MIKITSSDNRMFTPPQRTQPSASSGGRTQRNNARVGVEAKSHQTLLKHKPDRNHIFKSESGIPTGSPNTSIGYNQISVDLTPMLTGIGPRVDKPMFALYKDIYYNDTVAGAAVDLISSLPFSEFTLGGISDNKTNALFNEKMERLNVRTLLPELSVDYLVCGAHVSTMLYNKDKKSFTDIMCYDLEDCTFDEVPLYAEDPIITVDFARTAQMLQRTESPRIKRIRDQLGPKVMASIEAGQVELETLNTLYIPRKTFSSNQLGTSFYKRILPIYLIEKNLYRGTLMESARRQRGIMHITAGEPEVWDPTEKDLEFITELFMNADSDPVGAIIATKLGISIEEIRQGGDFWKVSEFQDSMQNAKYHALGMSDGLLSGEANFNTADSSLSIFIDMLRSHRDLITRKVFYNKLFPLISVLNGWAVNTKGKVINRDMLSEFDGNSSELVRKFNDGTSLLIPTVNWAKQLKPEGDQAYFDMLNTLTEKGVPVPLRVLAAAGGQNLDDLLRQQSDDIDMRKRINLYLKELESLKPKPAPGEEGTGDDYSAESSAFTQTDAQRRRLVVTSADPTGEIRSAVHASARGRRRIPLLSRDFGDAAEVKGQTKTGKPKAIFNQRAENQRLNSLISTAAARSSRRL